MSDYNDDFGRLGWTKYRWDKLCYDILNNTWTPEDEKFEMELVQILSKDFVVTIPANHSFFRARAIDGNSLSVEKKIVECKKGTENAFSAVDMDQSPIRGYSDIKDVGIPPMDKAQANRASYRDDPFLYVADTVYTAVTEVRPSILDIINVSTFSNQAELKVIKIPQTHGDARKMLQDESGQISLYLIEIAKTLSWAYSRPIRRSDADEEYLPTQRLVARLRERCPNLNGIAYPSLQSHSGMNYAFFKQDDLVLSDAPEMIIRIQDISYKCADLNNLENRIAPLAICNIPDITDRHIRQIKRQIMYNKTQGE